MQRKRFDITRAWAKQQKGNIDIRLQSERLKIDVEFFPSAIALTP